MAYNFLRPLCNHYPGVSFIQQKMPLKLVSSDGFCETWSPFTVNFNLFSCLFQALKTFKIFFFLFYALFLYEMLKVFSGESFSQLDLWLFIDDLIVSITCRWGELEEPKYPRCLLKPIHLQNSAYCHIRSAVCAVTSVSAVSNYFHENPLWSEKKTAPYDPRKEQDLKVTKLPAVRLII